MGAYLQYAPSYGCVCESRARFFFYHFLAKDMSILIGDIMIIVTHELKVYHLGE